MKYERYTRIELENGQAYTFDKYIFMGFISVLIIVFLSFILISGGLSANKNIYVSCNIKNNSGYMQPYCENPFYQNYKYCEDLWTGACEQQFLLSGFTYGKPPPKIMLWFNLLVFIGLIFTALLNHYIHNRTLKFNDLKIKKMELK